MIFKTFNNDIDKMSAKWGIFGKSFNDIGTAISGKISDINKNFQATDDLIGSIKNSGDSIWARLYPTKEQIASLEVNVPELIDTTKANEYLNVMKQIDAGIHPMFKSYQDWHDELSDGEKWIAKHAQSTQGQIRSLNGVTEANKKARDAAIAHNAALKQQTLGAKAGQVALKGLAMVGNMFAGFLIAKGFELVAKEIDKYVNRIEKAKEASEKFLSSFESSQQTLASHKELIKTVEDEYLGLSNGVDALGRNISLSTEDFQKYQNICNQIAEAYPQMVSAWDKEGNAVINLKNKVNELKEAYEEERIASLNSFVAGADKVTKAYKSSTDTSASFSFEKTSGYKQQLEALKETYKLLNEYKDKEKLSFLDKEAIASEISGSVANGLPSRLKKKLVNGILLSKVDINNVLRDINFKQSSEEIQTEIAAEIKNIEAKLANEQEPMREVTLKMFELEAQDKDKISDEAYQLGSSFINSLDDSFFNGKGEAQLRDFTTQLFNNIQTDAESRDVLKSLLGVNENIDTMTVSQYENHLKNVITKATDKLNVDESVILSILGIEDTETVSEYARRIITSLTDNLSKADLMANALNGNVYTNALEKLDMQTLSMLNELSPDEYSKFLSSIFTNDQITSIDTCAAAIKRYTDALKEKKSIESEKTDYSSADTYNKITENLNTLNKVMSEQNSNGKITKETYDELAALGDKYAKCVEYQNGALKLNTEALYDVQRAESEVVLENIAMDRSLATEKIEDNNKKLKEAKEALANCADKSSDFAQATREKINALNSENQQLQKTITSYDALSAAIYDSTSYMNQFKEAQQSQNSGANYDTLQDALKVIDEAMESGRKNTDEYKAALQLLFGEKLPKNLEKSLARVRKYIVDDNTSAQKIVGELNNYGYIKTNKDGQKVIDIDNLDEAANKMQITKEALVALLGEVNEFVQVDFNFSTDFDYWLDKLKEAGKVHIEGDQVKILVKDYKELADVLGTTQSQAEKFAEYTNGLGDYTIDIKYSDGEENKQSLQDSIKTVEDLNEQVGITNDAMNQLSKTQVSDFGMKNTNNVFKNTITLVQNLIGKVRTLNTELNKADTKVEKVSDKTDTKTTTTTKTKKPGQTVTDLLSGDAKAQGTMGATKDEKALVGELGTELLVRNGRYFTIGNKGAEFVNIKKNDIIFNHKQTAELLKNGYTLSRGKSLAQGNAYYTGTTSAESDDITDLLKGSNKSSTKKKKKKSSSRDKDKDTSKAKDAFSEVIDWIEIKLEKFAKNTEKLVKRIDKYISYINANKAVNNAITAVKREKNVNQQAYNRYMKQANSVGLSSAYKKKVQNGQINIQTIKDEKLKEKIDEYQKWYEKAQACKDTIAELNEQLTELAQKKLENITNWFDTRVGYKDARKNVYETSIAYREAQGKRGTDNQYKGLVDNNKSKQALLQNEYKKTTEQLNALVKAGSIKKYSKEWYEWQEKLREIQANINDCKTETIDLKKQWMDAKLTAFDKAIEKCADLQDELSDIIDLMNSDTFFNESGKLTEDGFTYIGMVGQQLASAKQEVLTYQEEMAKINEEYAKFKKGQESLITSEEDYKARIKEVTENQREAAKAVKDYRDALIDLKVKGIEAEIDALKELAEKNKELLNEEKNRDDYEKSIQDKTKSID